LFDLRYHVASLAAVFLALIIGILVGAGLASRTDLEQSERAVLERRIAELERANEDFGAQADLLRRQRDAAEEYVDATYPALMNGRLRGKRVAMLFTGQTDDGTIDTLQQTLEDASGPGIVEREALELPVNPEEVMDALGPQFSGLTMDEVGRRFGEELVEGGDTPVLDALIPILVQDRRGNPAVEADAVVVAHTGVPTDAPTRMFLEGVYAGLRASGVPVVGIERTDQRPSRIATYKENGISSVDSVDRPIGKLALALLLAGGAEGHYGLKSTAEDGTVPVPVEPLPLAPLAGG
jgi:Copper transport outer membrane protein, MctB